MAWQYWQIISQMMSIKLIFWLLGLPTAVTGTAQCPSVHVAWGWMHTPALAVALWIHGLSHHPLTSSTMAATTERAALLKHLRYVEIKVEDEFILVAIETQGPINEGMEERQSTFRFRQRVSVYMERAVFWRANRMTRRTPRTMRDYVFNFIRAFFSIPRERSTRLNKNIIIAHSPEPRDLSHLTPPPVL